MKIEDLRKPLEIHDIDFRVQSINKGHYVTVLAYKDARVDQNRLDEVVGAMNWKRHHTNNNHNCIVSIWNSETCQWISKEDVGTESMTEKEKGLASDSFKRACFNWGIGRELYDYPLIQFKLNQDEVEEFNGKVRMSYKCKFNEWRWFSQFENGKISFLGVKDTNNKLRYSWGEFKKDEVTK